MVENDDILLSSISAAVEVVFALHSTDMQQ